MQVGCVGCVDCAQFPATHATPAPHALPQTPQFDGSVVVSVHTPPQTVLPAGQTHENFGSGSLPLCLVLWQTNVGGQHFLPHVVNPGLHL